MVEHAAELSSRLAAAGGGPAGVRWVRASGFWLRVLDLLGCDGLTMPWRAVYLRPVHFANDGLRAHELVHIEQIDRDGAVRFSVRYLWWLVRYGYARNPYEVEAYGRSPDWAGLRDKRASTDG